MRKAESVAGEVAERGRSGVRSAGLTKAEEERVRAMERLANASDRATYLALQQEIAEQLKMTVRNVRYLMRGWQAEGVSGVIRQGRSDRGEQCATGRNQCDLGEACVEIAGAV
jgi:putative transposase